MTICSPSVSKSSSNSMKSLSKNKESLLCLRLKNCKTSLLHKKDCFNKTLYKELLWLCSLNLKSWLHLMRTSSLGWKISCSASRVSATSNMLQIQFCSNWLAWSITTVVASPNKLKRNLKSTSKPNKTSTNSTGNRPKSSRENHFSPTKLPSIYT